MQEVTFIVGFAYLRFQNDLFLGARAVGVSSVSRLATSVSQKYENS